MSKQFLTSDKVFAVKGYLSSNDKEVKPIGNVAFLQAQAHAHYVVTFAEMAKGKNFKGKEADSIEELKKEVLAKLHNNVIKEHIKEPKEPVREINAKLKEEALAFVKFEEDKENSKKINAYLDNFAIIDEFEEVGLFFDELIMKVDKIYTMKEIIKAVKETIDLL